MEVVDPMIFRMLAVIPGTVIILTRATIGHRRPRNIHRGFIASNRANLRQQRGAEHARIVNRTLPECDIAETRAGAGLLPGQPHYPVAYTCGNLKVSLIVENVVRLDEGLPNQAAPN